ncbi:hypothetical protein LV779_24750 [Streptomyces thinghirensis]|nr:hypothetical protein [Streptomyces thinghirensis]
MLTPAVTTDGWVRAHDLVRPAFADGLAPRAVTQPRPPRCLAPAEAALSSAASKLSEFAGEGPGLGCRPLAVLRRRPAREPVSGSLVDRRQPGHSLNAEGRPVLRIRLLDPEGTSPPSPSPRAHPRQPRGVRPPTPPTSNATPPAPPRACPGSCAANSRTPPSAHPRSIGYTQFGAVMGSPFSRHPQRLARRLQTGRRGGRTRPHLGGACD